MTHGQQIKNNFQLSKSKQQDKAWNIPTWIKYKFKKRIDQNLE